jgi:hypothetical protein
MSDKMESSSSQTLNVVRTTLRHPALRTWRGQFTPESVAQDLREATNRIFSVQSL